MQTIEINKIPALTWNWMKMNKGSISDEFDFSVKEPAIQSNTNIQISKEGLITSLPFSTNTLFLLFSLLPIMKYAITAFFSSLDFPNIIPLPT